MTLTNGYPDPYFQGRWFSTFAYATGLIPYHSICLYSFVAFTPLKLIYNSTSYPIFRTPANKNGTVKK